MEISHDIGIWIAALLTLGIFSFLWGDNPFYKICEAIFVGASAGYVFVIEVRNVIEPKLIGNLADGNWSYLIPGFLGIFMLFRLAGPKLSWLSRYAMSFVIGTYAGIFFINFLKENFLNQLSGTMVPLLVFDEQGWNLARSIDNTLMVVGVFSVLVYFFFSKAHKGAFGVTARVGVWYLMISFGAAFGYTVMARVSLLVGRVSFLFGDWLGML